MPDIAFKENAENSVVLEDGTKVKLSDLLEGHKQVKSSKDELVKAEQLKSALMKDKEIVEALKDGFSKKDEAALRSAFLQAGVEKDIVEAMFAKPEPKKPTKKSQVSDDDDEDDDDEDVVAKSKTTKKLLAIVNSMADKLKKLEENETNKQQHSLIRSRREEVNKAVDKDPVLRTILKKQSEKLRNKTFSDIYNAVDDAVEAGLRWGSGAIQKGIEEVRELLLESTGQSADELKQEAELESSESEGRGIGRSAALSQKTEESQRKKEEEEEAKQMLSPGAQRVRERMLKAVGLRR